MNNYMATKWITWKKCTGSYKNSIFKTEPGLNRNYEQHNYKHQNIYCIQNFSKN